MASLTGEIKRQTPLRAWFEQRLPNALEVSRDIRSRKLSMRVPRIKPDPIQPTWLGQAFGWRMTIGLDVPDDPAGTAAWEGWRHVAETAFGSGMPPPDEIDAYFDLQEGKVDGPVSELLEHARRHGGESRPDANDEMELAKVSVALAAYEACYRSGGVRHGDPVHDQLVELGADPPLDTLLDLCPPTAAEQLTELVALARRGLAELFPADVIECDPSFDVEGLLADGDVIISTTPVGYKCVSSNRPKREWMWQIAGYLLCDRGRRQLDWAGLYLARHGHLQLWDVQELFDRLAGHSVDVNELLEEFHGHVRRAPTV